MINQSGRIVLVFLILVILPIGALSSPALRPVSPVDDIDRLGETVEKNIYQLDVLTGTKGDLGRRAWADRQWRTENGIIGERYSDFQFDMKGSFDSRYDYVKDHPLKEIYKKKGGFLKRDRRGTLSPSEKYDLLVGDLEGTLTRALWEEGKFYDKAGKLAHWMGICEGTAVSGLMFKEPTKAIEVPSRIAGKTVKFNALDIKALASLLWSNYTLDIPIVGSRCSEGGPSRDRNGAIRGEDCFNNNPATWHVAVTNFVGSQKRPLVIDYDLNHEVWNLPVISYSFKYFNPKNQVPAKNLQDAIVTRADFSKDRYKDLRSANAEKYVGIEMEVVLAGVTEPSVNGSTLRTNKKENYRYDLELDSSGTIVGGEWYSGRNPDFLWVIPKDFKAESIGDRALPPGDLWDGKSPIPEFWVTPAHTSAVRLQPLAAIVRKLVELSSQ